MSERLRFFGQYLDTAEGYKAARQIVKDEMEARKPDRDEPQGYLPDPDFQEGVQKFDDQVFAYSEKLLNRAMKSEKVTEREIVALERGEKLLAAARAPGPQVARAMEESLDAGQAFGRADAMSNSRHIRKLTGLDGDRPGTGGGFTLRVDHGKFTK